MTGARTTERIAATARRPEAGARGAGGGASAASALGRECGQVFREAAAANRRERRNAAWAMRRRLWDLSSLSRVRACGRVSRSPEGGPTLRLSDDGQGGQVAGLAGLVHCGSPWACPTCARKIGAKRAQEITEVVEAVYAEGGSAALVTLTLRHHAGQRLGDLWDALQYAWSRVTSGRRYQQECETFGVEGWCRAVEVTTGDAGWHPHLHVLVMFDTPMSAEMVQEMAGRWWTRWEAAIVRRGYSAVAARGGLDARVVTIAPDGSGVLGRYLSKIAYETTGGMGKGGRAGNRSPFELLADGLATGLADDVERWWEFEQASHGRKQLTWSRGVRDRFRLGEEATDEEIVADDLGTDDLIALPAQTWAAIRDRAELFLSIAETDGLSGATAYLSRLGLDWSRVTRPAPPPRRRTAGSRPPSRPDPRRPR